MAGYLSDGTTVLSNLSLTGQILATGINASSGLTTSILTASRVSSNVSILANAVWASGVSAQGSIITGGSVNVLGGLQASGVTLDLRTNSVIPSMVTYAGGASISGLTIGQWGFVFNASGFSIAFSSGKTAYFFGGSTLSAAIT